MEKQMVHLAVYGHHRSNVECTVVKTIKSNLKGYFTFFEVGLYELYVMLNKCITYSSQLLAVLQFARAEHGAVREAERYTVEINVFYLSDT